MSMSKAFWGGLGIAAVATLAGGCQSVHNLDSADMYGESAVVVARPHNITLFKTASLARCLETTYAAARENEAGQLTVQVGLRNKGPTQWFNWMNHAPEALTVYVTCNYYETPAGAASATPIIYSTDRRQLVLPRGETVPYSAVCPFPGAMGFQLVIGE